MVPTVSGGNGKQKPWRNQANACRGSNISLRGVVIEDTAENFSAKCNVLPSSLLPTWACDVKGHFNFQRKFNWNYSAKFLPCDW